MAAPLERRRPEKGLITHVVELFNGKQGRKVAFGIWGFWVSTGLLMKDKITGEIWWWVFLTSAALIGFGTTFDSVVTKLGDAIAAVFADKVSRFKSVVSVTESKVTTEVETDDTATV